MLTLVLGLDLSPALVGAVHGNGSVGLYHAEGSLPSEVSKAAGIFESVGFSKESLFATSLKRPFRDGDVLETFEGYFNAGIPIGRVAFLTGTWQLPGDSVDFVDLEVAPRQATVRLAVSTAHQRVHNLPIDSVSSFLSR